MVLFNRERRPDPPPPDVQVIYGDRRVREDFESKLRVEKFDEIIDMIPFDADHAASSLRAFRSRVDHFVHCFTAMSYGPPFSGAAAGVAPVKRYWSITEPSTWSRVATTLGVKGCFFAASSASSTPMPGASGTIR